MSTDDRTVVIREDLVRDALVIQVRRRDPLGTGIQYGQPARLGTNGITAYPGEWTTVPNDGGEVDPHPGLSLRYDDARALYQALADHFDGPSRPQGPAEVILESYASERARVDKMLDAILATALPEVRA